MVESMDEVTRVGEPFLVHPGRMIDVVLDHFLVKIPERETIECKRVQAVLAEPVPEFFQCRTILQGGCCRSGKPEPNSHRTPW